MLGVCVNQVPHVGPCVVILKLSVCIVCFLRGFPLTQRKSTVSFLNTSHHHCTLIIHYLILSSTQSFLKFGEELFSSSGDGVEKTGPRFELQY